MSRYDNIYVLSWFDWLHINIRELWNKTRLRGKHISVLLHWHNSANTFVLLFEGKTHTLSGTNTSTSYYRPNRYRYILSSWL